MKKALALITLLIYSVVSCGVVISQHYCMNQLESTRIFSGSDDYCGKCGMHTDDSDGCCRDEAIVIRLDEAQQKVTSIAFELTAPVTTDQALSEFIQAEPVSETASRYTPAIIPPLLPENERYLQCRVFLI